MGFNFRDKKPLKTYGIEWAAIPFSFIPNSTTTTSNPLSSQISGPVTVSVAGTGLYNVALVGGSPNAVLGGLVCETALKGLFQVDAANVSATAGTFQIRAYTFATTTLINFTATTSVQKVHGVIYQQLSSFTR